MIENDHFDDFVDVFAEYKQTPNLHESTDVENYSPD